MKNNERSEVTEEGDVSLRRRVTSYFKRVGMSDDLTSRYHKRNISDDTRRRKSIQHQIKNHGDSKFFAQHLSKVVGDHEKPRRSKSGRYSRRATRRKS